MAESKTPWEQASEWFARTIAIVVVMVAPGALGSWLDGRCGTSFFAAIGFALGMILAIGLLMLFVRIKPIANDGDIMKRGSANRVVPSDRSDPLSGSKKPSEARLPDMPGADVLEPRRDE